MTLKAEKFEELLSSELSSALEPQRGKALAAFRAHAAEEAQRPAVAGSLKDQAERGRQISRTEMYFWSSVPSLVAACLAVVVTLKVLLPAGATAPIGTPAGLANKTIIVTPQLQQTDIVSSVDDRVIVDNNSATRVTREQKESTTQWVDPNDQSIYKLTQPGENVKYEQLVPF